MITSHYFIFIIIFTFIFYTHASTNVIWAVNCGGDAHVDLNGVKYQKDSNSIGVASDYGKNMMINRIPQEDQTIYQTERYHTANFGYEIPIPSDGNYVLVLKFSEVWFTAPNQKVFDVMLNAEHTVVERLDIFHKVGRGTAHDEIIPFRVKDGKIYVKEESSDLYYNKILVEFIKGDRDNPKVNAIVLIKGSIEEVPKLPPISFQNENEVTGQNTFDQGNQEPEHHQAPETDDDDNLQHNSDNSRRRKRLTSGPKSPDPYSTDDTSSMFFPLAVAIGAFLPILFCLCKL